MRLQRIVSHPLNTRLFFEELLLAYAALLVIVMLVRPAGLIPAARRQREFEERDAELETIESS